MSAGRARAREILHACVTPFGLRASGLAAGYPQIWARDSMVTFLGAAATGDPELLGRLKGSATSFSVDEGETKTLDLKISR